MDDFLGKISGGVGWEGEGGGGGENERSGDEFVLEGEVKRWMVKKYGLCYMKNVK